jgi:hypothetical protein
MLINNRRPQIALNKNAQNCSPISASEQRSEAWLGSCVSPYNTNRQQRALTWACIKIPTQTTSVQGTTNRTLERKKIVSDTPCLPAESFRHIPRNTFLQRHTIHRNHFGGKNRNLFEDDKEDPLQHKQG